MSDPVTPDTGRDALPPAPEDGGSARPPVKFGKFGVEALIVGSSRFFTRAATFATGIVIARLLGPEGRGMVAALQVPAQLAVNIAEAGVRQAAAFHVGRHSFPPERVVATLLGMLPLGSLIAIGLALGYFWSVDVADDDVWLWLLAVAAIPSSVGVAYIGGVLLGLGKISQFSRASWLPASIVLLCTVVIAWLLDWGVYGVFAAAALGNLAGFAYALYVLSKHAKLGFRIDRAVLKGIRSHGIMYAVASLALLLNYKVMVLVLSHASTLEEVGYYSQASSIAEILWEVPQMVSALLFSRAVNTTDRDLMSEKILTFARMAGIFVLFAAIGVGAISFWLFPFVYGPEFAPSAIVCIALLPGVVAVVIWRILQSDIHGRGKAWVTTAIIVPCILLNVALGYWLGSRHGAVGAAAASSVAFVVATLAYVVVYSRMTGFTLWRMIRPRRADFLLVFRSLPIPQRIKARFTRPASHG